MNPRRLLDWLSGEPWRTWQFGIVCGWVWPIKSLPLWLAVCAIYLMLFSLSLDIWYQRKED